MLIVVKHPLAWLQTMRERAPEGMHASFKRVCHHHSWEGRNRAIDAVRAHIAIALRVRVGGWARHASYGRGLSLNENLALVGRPPAAAPQAASDR